jgi:hypothetical protein
MVVERYEQSRLEKSKRGDFLKDTAKWARSPSEGAQSGPEVFRHATIHRRTRAPLLRPIRLVERHHIARPSLHSLAQFGRHLEQQLRQLDNRGHRQAPANGDTGVFAD